jgi:repressor LexA
MSIVTDMSLSVLIPMPKTPPPMQTPGSVIAARRRQLSMTQPQLAEAAGVSQPTISEIENGVSELTAIGLGRVVSLARSLQWSLLEIEQATGIDLGLKNSLKDRPSRTVLAYRIGANPRITDPESQDDPIAHELVEEFSRPGSQVFIVEGDSMAPGIYDSNAIYADTHDKTVIDGKVYVVRAKGNGRLLKRARKVGTRFIFISDNPMYAALERGEVEIIGRVYYVQPGGRYI